MSTMLAEPFAFLGIEGDEASTYGRLRAVVNTGTETWGESVSRCVMTLLRLCRTEQLDTLMTTISSMFFFRFSLSTKIGNREPRTPFACRNYHSYAHTFSHCGALHSLATPPYNDVTINFFTTLGVSRGVIPLPKSRYGLLHF